MGAKEDLVKIHDHQRTKDTTAMGDKGDLVKWPPK
jgi:hypothetical protein